MKRFIGFALTAFALSLPAFAAKNSQDITVSKAIKVGATQVSAGDYKISWTGTDSNVQVSFTQNGKTIVTTKAKLIPGNNTYVSLGTKTVNGANILESIQLKKLTLEISGSTASGE